MDTATRASAKAHRLVLDTNVWLDLLLFADPRCERLRRALDSGAAVALVDSHCRDEWLRVLGYPLLRLTKQRADALQAAFDGIAVRLDTPVRARPWPALPRCRDPDDQKFLELACAADAGLLLSRDAALLSLAGRCRRSGLFRIDRPESFETS